MPRHDSRVARLVSWLFRWLEIVFKYGLPVVLGTLVIACVVEHYRPWSVADSVLGPFSQRPRIMIGFSIHSDGTETSRSADYLLLPALSPRAQVVTVRQVDNLPPSVTTAEENVISSLLWLCGCLAVSAWLWLRPNAWRDLALRWSERARR